MLVQAQKQLLLFTLNMHAIAIASSIWTGLKHDKKLFPNETMN